jgi:hypothetical protein
LKDFAMSPNSAPDHPLVWDACPEAPISVSAMVTKLLDRKDWRKDPLAMKAIQAEAAGLLQEKTWLLETVIEKKDLREWAQKTNTKVHFGELLLLCSIKYWEMGPAYWKHKGRICFRGDNAKDEGGALAVYQELSASPTTIHSANNNIAYGCIPGHKTTQADAIRAYVQCLLKSMFLTYVLIPRELWPEAWHKEGKVAPMCKLHKALYGHPESGGHWERHLTDALVALGGEPIQAHPSSFFFKKTKLLLTVYVDDLLLSGPSGEHTKFWKSLSTGVKAVHIEDPTDLDRFLGRGHPSL